MFGAIDQSLTKTGVARVLSDNTVVSATITTKASMPWAPRMEKILNFLEYFFSPKYLEDNGYCGKPIEYLVLEDYAYAGASKGFVLGELGGLIKYWSYKKGFNTYQVNCKQHKIFITGNGNSEKEVAYAKLRSMGHTPANFDESDAICMLLLLIASKTDSIFDKLSITKKRLIERCGIKDEDRNITRKRKKVKRKSGKLKKRKAASLKRPEKDDVRYPGQPIDFN